MAGYGTAYVNVVVTGICTYVLTECDGKNEVRFVMPNGRNGKFSARKPGKWIPPHKPFLMAPYACAVGESGSWLGRPPDGYVAGNWLYWTLGREEIFLDGDPEKGVRVVDDSSVIDMPAKVQDAGIPDNCVHTDKQRVGARLVLRSGFLAQRGITVCNYDISSLEAPPTGQHLADEVVVAIPRVRLSKHGNVSFRTRRLNKKKFAAKAAIVLKPKGFIEVFIGNAPEVDFAAVVGSGPNHEHGDENLHFELYYEVATKKPPPPPPVPVRVSGGCDGYPGPLPGTDSCPPTKNKSTGS